MAFVDQPTRWFSDRLQRLSAAPGPRWPALTPLATGLERAIRLLDSAIPVPGTGLRVGLDPLLGLVFPTVGDAVSGFASLGILGLAVQYRVPKLVVGRMVFNVAVDTAVGSVPVVGDIFDFVWKANERNLALLATHRTDIVRPVPLAYRLYIGGLWLFGLACVLAPAATLALLLLA